MCTHKSYILPGYEYQRDIAKFLLLPILVLVRCTTLYKDLDKNVVFGFRKLVRVKWFAIDLKGICALSTHFTSFWPHFTGCFRYF